MSSLTRVRPATVLLVEDDPGDQELTRRSFAKHKIRNELHIVSDGEQALDYLFRPRRYADPRLSPRPDLVLLDLNLPRIDGKAVLREIRASEELRHIPVVVLTTSSEESDVVRSYDLGASSYVVKPVDLAQFGRVLAALEDYWFEIVVVPYRDPGFREVQS